MYIRANVPINASLPISVNPNYYISKRPAQRTNTMQDAIQHLQIILDQLGNEINTAFSNKDFARAHGIVDGIAAVSNCLELLKAIPA